MYAHTPLQAKLARVGRGSQGSDLVTSFQGIPQTALNRLGGGIRLLPQLTKTDSFSRQDAD